MAVWYPVDADSSPTDATAGRSRAFLWNFWPVTEPGGPLPLEGDAEAKARRRKPTVRKIRERGDKRQATRSNSFLARASRSSRAS